MGFYRLRHLIAGGLAGARCTFGGSRTQLRFPSTFLGALFESNVAVMDRRTEGNVILLANMACSLVDSQEVHLVMSEPDRDRRLQVVDGQRCSYHARMARPESNRNPPPNNNSSRGNFRGHAPKIVREKSYRPV